LDKDIVGIGSRVTLYCEEFGEDEEYIIVGSAESNPAGGKISNESPLGSVVIGCRVGDEGLVEAPAGTIKYVVKNIA
jgi:transcription elongation factor GreA